MVMWGRAPSPVHLGEARCKFFPRPTPQVFPAVRSFRLPRNPSGTCLRASLLAPWSVTPEATMDSGTITGFALAFFLVGALVYIVILYNGLVRLRNENDRAWA